MIGHSLEARRGEEIGENAKAKSQRRILASEGIAGDRHVERAGKNQ